MTETERWSVMTRMNLLFNLICRTAVNHRFFRIEPPYERLMAVCDGVVLRGSDVLCWHADKYGEALFDIDKVNAITPLDVATKLGFAPLGNDDCEERSRLLRELAWANNDDLKYFAHEHVDIDEFSKWIKAFEAFNDPMSKKVHLIVKILTQNGFWPDVTGDFQVPLDYHTVGMAVRLGEVKPNRHFEEKVLMPMNEWVIMRNAAFRFYRSVVKETGQDPYELDDMIWQRSRNFCREMNCMRCSWRNECERVEGELLANTVWF